MFKPILAYISLAAAAVMLPCTANAWLWGLFGHDKDKWRNMEPAQQDIEAQHLIKQARELNHADKFKKARKMYARVWNNFPSSKYAPEALFELGHMSMRQQKWRYAVDSYNVLIRAYPENKNFDDMVSDLFTIGEAYETGKGIHYIHFIPYKDQSKAMMVYENVASVAPYSDLAATALIRVAMLHRERHEFIAAVSTVNRILNDYPTSLETPNATILMGDFISSQVAGPAYDQGATHQAIDYYRDFSALYPNNPGIKYCEDRIATCSEQYAESKALMGEFFFKYRDDYDSAAVFFNDAITIAPESKCAETARSYLDRIAKIKERYPDGKWPRRTDWQYLYFWRRWDPMKGKFLKKDEINVAPNPEDQTTASAAPAAAESTETAQ